MRTQENDDASTPRLAIDGPVATLTLNRPAQRNRLDDADLHALLAAFARIDADPQVRAVVLTANTQGQPRPVFCAGYDIGEFEGGGGGPALFERVADALAALRPVTVCALNGSVHGGATDLALACDLRVALAGIELRMPAAALGLHYYPGGLRRFVARLGLAGAQRAFLTARAFSAQRLLDMGLLEEVAPDPQALDACVRRLVADICVLAPMAVQATKRSLNEIAAGHVTDATLRERERRSLGSAEFAEGVRAFRERRAPDFSGR